MQDYLSNAATNAGDFLSAFFGTFSGLSHELALADPTNIRLAAVLLPVVLGCWFFAFRRYWRLRHQYGKRQLVDINSDKIRLRGELARLSFRLLVPVAVCAALLNPYLPGVPHLVPSGNRDYAICVADNRGMGAVDVPPGETTATAAGEPQSKPDATAGNGNQFFNETGSRMDLVRNVIRQLLAKALVRTPVSLIAFQGGANVLVPLTDSPDWLNDTIDPTNKFGLRVGMSSPVGRGQVDGKVSTIASCLQAAREVFKEGGNKDHEKWIIYFGNGDDISADKWMADEVQKLHDENIHGVIFGVGGAEIPIPIYNGDDEQFAGYYKFRSGKEALSGYNEENLLKLSQATGWQYFHLDPKHMPNMDFFVQQLTDAKLEVGRWLVFDYPVEVALAVIALIGLSDTFSLGLGWMIRRRRNHRRWP